MNKLNIKCGIEQEFAGQKSRLMTGDQAKIEEIAEKVNEIIDLLNSLQDKPLPDNKCNHECGSNGKCDFCEYRPSKLTDKE